MTHGIMQKRCMRTREVLFTALVVWCAPAFVAAASVNNVLLSMSPLAPTAESAFTVTATVLDGDSKVTQFTWLVNDEKVLEGVGAKQLTTIAPPLGESMVIRLVTDGNERSTPLIVRPGRVSVEWEAVTTHPPFYTGRSLVGGQGTVHVSAIADLVRSSGGRVAPQDILYEWRVNNTPQPAQSGLGVYAITLNPPFYDDPFTVSVKVSSRDGISAESSVAIAPAQPDIVIYEISPLSGLRDERAIRSDFTLSGNEVTFIAYPRHMSRPGGVTVGWRLGNEGVAANEGDPRTVVFRKTGEGSGTYAVSVGLSSVEAFLDVFSRSFLLHF